MNILGWLNDQVLRMQLAVRSGDGRGRAVGLDPTSRVGGSVQFFVYDVIKIFILLVGADLRHLLGPELFPARADPPHPRRAGPASGRNTLAALLGTMTPFCSCSSIPIFIGFTAAGLPLAVTFSFLISSPLGRSGFGDPAGLDLQLAALRWPMSRSVWSWRSSAAR